MKKRLSVLVVVVAAITLSGCAAKSSKNLAMPSAQLALPVGCIDKAQVVSGAPNATCEATDKPDVASCKNINVMVHFTCTKVSKKGKKT